MHAGLNLDGIGDGIHDATKFGKEAVAGRASDAAAMLFDRRIEELPAVLSPTTFAGFSRIGSSASPFGRMSHGVNSNFVVIFGPDLRRPWT